MRANRWKQFEAALKRYGAKYERRFKADHSVLGLYLTLEFWVPGNRSYDRPVQVFFRARHPNRKFFSHRRVQKSFKVAAYVGNKKSSLRDAYYVLSSQAVIR